MILYGESMKRQYNSKRIKKLKDLNLIKHIKY